VRLTGRLTGLQTMHNGAQLAKRLKKVAVRLRLIFQFIYVQYCIHTWLRLSCFDIFGIQQPFRDELSKYINTHKVSNWEHFLYGRLVKLSLNCLINIYIIMGCYSRFGYSFFKLFQQCFKNVLMWSVITSCGLKLPT